MININNIFSASITATYCRSKTPDIYKAITLETERIIYKHSHGISSDQIIHQLEIPTGIDMPCKLVIQRELYCYGSPTAEMKAVI